MEGLTKKEKAFADEYLETGNGTQSALKTYDTESENMAAVLASRTIRKDKVRAYLEDKAERAAQRIVELSEQDENKPVALGASKDIMDRSGYKPQEQIDLTTKGESLNKEISDEEYDSILNRLANKKSSSSDSV